MMKSNKASIVFTIDGQDYPFGGDLSPRELGYVKRVSGVRAGELEEALQAGDAEVVVALALIAARRAGQTPDEDALLDGKAEVGVRFEDGADAGPPTDGVVEAAPVPSSPSPTTL